MESLHDVTHGLSLCVRAAPQPTFLILPPSIRARIYTEAGLSRDCPIRVDYEDWRLKRDRGPASLFCTPESRRAFGQWTNQACHIRSDGSRVFKHTSCRHEAFPVALFGVNRQIHDECLKHLYGSNKFLCIGEGEMERGQLQSWAKLSPRARESITSLEVEFNNIQWPITAKFAKVESYLNRLSRIFQKLPPGQLSLTLNCPAEDVDTLATLVRGLCKLPILRELRYHFGFYLELHSTHRTMHRAQSSLRELSTRTLIAGGGPSQSFPFEKLPVELQLLVLEQCLISAGYPLAGGSKTDLQNLPQLGAALATTKLLASFGNTRRLEKGYDISRCFKYSANGSHSVGRTCCAYCASVSASCYCNFGLSWSSTCVCSALFKVSKTFRARILDVYFWNNLFEIKGDTGKVVKTIRRAGRTIAFALRHLCFTVRIYPPSLVRHHRDTLERLFLAIHDSCNTSELQLHLLVQSRPRIEHFSLPPPSQSAESETVEFVRKLERMACLSKTTNIVWDDRCVNLSTPHVLKDCGNITMQDLKALLDEYKVSRRD